MTAVENKSGTFLEQKVTRRRQLASRFLFGFVILLVCVAIFFGLRFIFSQKSVAEHHDSSETLPVEVVQLVLADSFSMQRTYTGVMKSARASELSFKQTEKLVSVLVNEGDRVEAGELLAVLDVRKLRAKEKELIAKKKAATALLDELKAGPRMETIASSRADVAQRLAELELQRAELKRVKKLFEDEVISRSEFDAARFAEQVAIARHEAAHQKFVELETGTRLEKIKSQEAAVEQVAALLLEIRADIEDSSLLAPYAGVIAKRNLDEGTIVSPGTSLLRLVDDTNLEAWIGMPAEVAMKFYPGQHHALKVGNQTVEANVSSAVPELNTETRTRTVIFKLKPEATKKVVPFQIVRMKIEEENQTPGYWVPVSSLIQSTRGLWAVYVVEKEEKGSALVVVRREVEVLHLQDVRAFVRGTIQSKEKIIADGTHRIVPGQQVRIAKQHVTTQRSESQIQPKNKTRK